MSKHFDYYDALYAAEAIDALIVRRIKVAAEEIGTKLLIDAGLMSDPSIERIPGGPTIISGPLEDEQIRRLKSVLCDRLRQE